MPEHTRGHHSARAAASRSDFAAGSRKGHLGPVWTSEESLGVLDRFSGDGRDPSDNGFLQQSGSEGCQGSYHPDRSGGYFGIQAVAAKNAGGGGDRSLLPAPKGKLPR
jgi:hypothetical protein